MTTTAFPPSLLLTVNALYKFSWIHPALTAAFELISGDTAMKIRLLLLVIVLSKGNLHFFLSVLLSVFCMSNYSTW